MITVTKRSIYSVLRSKYGSKVAFLLKVKCLISWLARENRLLSLNDSYRMFSPLLLRINGKRERKNEKESEGDHCQERRLYFEAMLTSDIGSENNDKLIFLIAFRQFISGMKGLKMVYIVEWLCTAGDHAVD